MSREAAEVDRATFVDLVGMHARRRPEAPAVIDPPDRESLVGTAPRSLTWQQFARAVDGAATMLLERGLKRGEVVTLQLPNVWELAVGLLAVGRAGGVASPAPMQWREHELRYIMELTGSRLLLGTDRFKETRPLATLAPALPEVERVDLEELARWTTRTPDEGALEAVRPAEDDTFTICWTSGTEAEPKGCPLSYGNWRWQSGTITQVCRLSPGDRVLATAPLVNMTGVGVVLLPWVLAGGELVLHHPLDLSLLLEQITGHGADFTVLVPALLTMILKRPDVDELDLSSLRSVATGSAPPSGHAMAEFLRRWGIEIVHLWGQNEGTLLASTTPDVPDPEERVDHFPWWGKPGIEWPSGVSGAEARVVDDSGKALTEPGAVGELAFRGPAVFSGYYRRPDLAERSFTPDGFFLTGDHFRVVDERHLAFYDRKKDIIIRGGNNISAAEVETLALAHPGVRDAAAIAWPDEVLGERVCLCAVAQDPDTPPTLEDIVGSLREAGLATYKLPEHLELVDLIPRNPVGKIVKSELRDSLTGGSPAA